MAFINSIKDIHPGYGSPGLYLKREAVATNVGTTNIAMPAAGSFAEAISCGRIRVKTATVAAGGTVQLGAITATDGTTTVVISPQQTVLAANALLDMTIEFRTDLKLTSMTIPVIAAVANSTHDVEIAANC
jgi:hypothetical protein